MPVNNRDEFNACHPYIANIFPVRDAHVCADCGKQVTPESEDPRMFIESGMPHGRYWIRMYHCLECADRLQLQTKDFEEVSDQWA
jgi:DNA-directed RNA polymerase subunit RPC12/RpoP